MMRLAINTVASQTTTKEEEALGHFTCQKLKKLDNWNALTAILNYKLYGSDEKEAYAHSPPPKCPHLLSLMVNTQIGMNGNLEN